MHGDVENLSGDWVFPYDPGRVFDSLLQSLDQSDKPQFALIVGYNEWEEVVHEKLITWLEENIPTVLRVRPNWNEQDPNGICEPAKRFFARLNIYFKMETESH